MSTATLSTLATFDDIRRCIQVLTEGSAEEEFLRVLRLQEKFRQECLLAAQETQRIQKELDASLKSMADLETKLFHARRLLEMETKARREAEHDRDQMEKKIVAVADLLQHERNLKDETKDKLAFLNTLPRKRKSLNPHVEEKYGNDINSTGSFLSDLSITQSEDDFLDVNNLKTWQKHRPSIPKNQIPCIGNKRSRQSVVGSNATHATPPTTRRSIGRRSDFGVQQHLNDIPNGTERICATTKVLIPQDGTGNIRAESTIETLPMSTNHPEIVGDGHIVKPIRSLVKEAAAIPLSPMHNLSTAVHAGSPAQSRPGMLRHHNFATKTFIRSDTCMQCQKKIRFGAVGLRCRDCPIRCHVDCRYLLSVSCVPQSSTPTIKGNMGCISDHAPSTPPMIPALIVHCVNEIETRGLTEIGIYRVSGSEREVKSLKERFLRGKNMPHLGNIDVHVLCGCVKDFLRSLREPLIPTDMWKDFCNGVQDPCEDKRNVNLFKAIDNLPQANRDSLAFLILHFQRIADCPDVRMPIDNIARVFGPTIVGYSSLDPDQHAIFSEVNIQFAVMMHLLKIPTDYWTQFVGVDLDKENMPSTSLLYPAVVALKTPKQQNSNSNKDSIYSLYASPLKSTLKKRKFYATPPYSAKK